MFKNLYQSGPYVELFHPQDKRKLWKVTGRAGKSEYDRQVKSYVLNLEGSNMKLQIPAGARDNLRLVQRYLVLQVFVPQGRPFTVESVVTTSKGTKHRLIFSQAIKDYNITPLHVRIPIRIVKAGQWINLTFDFVSFVNYVFPTQTYRSIESIIISAPCRLRRVFTMRQALMGSIDENSLPVLAGTEIMPRNLQFPAGTHVESQLLQACELPRQSSSKDTQYDRRHFKQRGSAASVAYDKLKPELSPPPQKVRRNLSSLEVTSAMPDNPKFTRAESVNSTQYVPWFSTPQRSSEFGVIARKFSIDETKSTLPSRYMKLRQQSITSVTLDQQSNIISPPASPRAIISNQNSRIISNVDSPRERVSKIDFPRQLISNLDSPRFDSPRGSINYLESPRITEDPENDNLFATKLRMFERHNSGIYVQEEDDVGEVSEDIQCSEPSSSIRVEDDPIPRKTLYNFGPNVDKTEPEAESSRSSLKAVPTFFLDELKAATEYRPFSPPITGVDPDLGDKLENLLENKIV